MELISNFDRRSSKFIQSSFLNIIYKIVIFLMYHDDLLYLRQVYSVHQMILWAQPQCNLIHPNTFYQDTFIRDTTKKGQFSQTHVSPSPLSHFRHLSFPSTSVPTNPLRTRPFSSFVPSPLPSSVSRFLFSPQLVLRHTHNPTHCAISLCNVSFSLSFCYFC